MYVEGKNMLHAFDAYTGRLLWKAEFADAPKPADRPRPTSTSARSARRPRPAKTHLVTVHDAVYRVTGTKLIALDARTGKPLTGFQFDQEGQWGAIKVWKNFLIAPVGGRLLVANRHTGDVLWRRDRSAPLAVAAGGGMLFCVESDSPSHEDSTRRGQSPGKPLLVALNLKDGSRIWRKTEGHGPRLTYSESHDVLLVTDSVAYRGKDGTKLWGAPSLRAPRSKHRSVVTRDMIFANSQRRKLFLPRNLLTGEDFMQDDPWTGKAEPFYFSRSHGCGGILGGEHILTFRSSTAGFFDLVSGSGTSNFGGFRSGCVPNLVPADGLLNAPTNVRGCSCTWPIRASLAMVHMPELEVWAAYLPYGWLDERDHAAPVKRLGLNFGAPGDRRVPGGTLWVDYPSVGGPSPEVKVRTVPEVPESFRYHSMRVAGSGLKWVAASGLKGVESLSITLDESGGPERRFTIRLHFAEPDRIAPGQRVFDVKLQGQNVLNDFDVVEETGGPNRAVVREFTGIRAGRDLKVAFEPSAHSPLKAALICGIEIVEESPSGVAGIH